MILGKNRQRMGWLVSVGSALVIGGLVGLAACVGSDSDTSLAPTTDGGPDGGPPGTNPGAALSLANLRPRVRRGAEIDVELRIVRGTVSGELPITITGLPTGVTAAAPPIGPAASATPIHFTAGPVRARRATAPERRLRHDVRERRPEPRHADPRGHGGRPGHVSLGHPGAGPDRGRAAPVRRQPHGHQRPRSLPRTDLGVTRSGSAPTGKFPALFGSNLPATV
jgi:hypothetical protein